MNSRNSAKSLHFPLRVWLPCVDSTVALWIYARCTARLSLAFVAEILAVDLEMGAGATSCRPSGCLPR